MVVPNMAAGHILPGYREPVTRLQRALSAGCCPLDSTSLKEREKAACLSQQEVSQIRENARWLWSKQYPRTTTYETFFSDGEIREITQLRPTSRNRRNNPHPTQLFITNRLHFIDGFHKPNVALGKSAYRVDASVSSAVQKQRQALHGKYVARPDAALINPYKDLYGFKKFLPPREAQAAEAWVKLTDDSDHDRIMEVLKEQANMAKLNKENKTRSKSAYPSLHRWMRMCGAEENEAVSRIMQTPSAHSVTKCKSYGTKPHFVRSQSKTEKLTVAMKIGKIVTIAEYRIVTIAEYGIVTIAEYGIVTIAEYGIVTTAEYGIVTIAEYGIVTIAEYGIVSIAEYGIVTIEEYGIVTTAEYGIVTIAEYGI